MLCLRGGSTSTMSILMIEIDKACSMVGRPETKYSLRTRSHNKLLIPKTSDLDDRHFIIRSLYKNLYWCDQTSVLTLLHICGVTVAFYSARPICVVLYTFMNFVHSCVWQLFFKEWKMRWDEACGAVDGTSTPVDRLSIFDTVTLPPCRFQIRFQSLKST